MKFQLNKELAGEVSHKLGILADEKELQDSYGLTQDEADALLASVPNNGGEWVVSEGKLLDAVRGEIENHISLLQDQAWEMKDTVDTAFSMNEKERQELKRQVRATNRLANSLEKLFGLDKVESAIINLTAPGFTTDNWINILDETGYQDAYEYVLVSIAMLEATLQGKAKAIGDSYEETELASMLKLKHKLEEEAKQKQIHLSQPLNLSKRSFLDLERLLNAILQTSHGKTWASNANEYVESAITNLTSGNQAKVEQACSIKRLTNIHDAPHDQFLEALLNELTGSGGAGSYEMPLSATPYWKTKKRKKKVTQQNIVTMK